MRLKSTLLAVFILAIATPATADIKHAAKKAVHRHSASCATCYGDRVCNACKNCNYCKNCNNGGTLCGVYYEARGIAPPWDNPATHKRHRRRR